MDLDKAKLDGIEVVDPVDLAPYPKLDGSHWHPVPRIPGRHVPAQTKAISTEVIYCTPFGEVLLETVEGYGPDSGKPWLVTAYNMNDEPIRSLPRIAAELTAEREGRTLPDPTPGQYTMKLHDGQAMIWQLGHTWRETLERCTQADPDKRRIVETFLAQFNDPYFDLDPDPPEPLHYNPSREGKTGRDW